MPPKDEVFAEKKVGILLLEDNEDDAHFILSELKKGAIPHLAKCISRRDEFIANLAEFKPDLILSDYKLPEFDELEPLHIVRQASPDLPFILVTGALGDELAVEIIKKGATDYILKDRLFRLVPAVQRALREVEERRQRRKADKLLIKQHEQLQRQNEALRRAEENYRSIYENAIEGIFQTTPDGHYLSANPALARMLGYSSPQDLVTSIQDLGTQMCVKPESRLELKKRLEMEGQVRGFENEVCRKDGSRIWISVNAHIVRDTDGKVLYYEGTSQDISERKRAEEALRESEERFRQLAESIREVFWMTDIRKNETIYISPGYESVWGRSCQSLYDSPRDWVDAIHSEDRHRVLEAALKKQSIGDYNEIYRIVRPDGTIRWIHDRAFPIRNEQGEVYRVTGIAEDITDWKSAEAKLATLAHAVESTDEMICITDLDDKFTFANPAFLRGYGYTEAEIIGKTPHILFSPQNPPTLMAEILKKTREGGWHGEVTDRRKDGTDFPISLGTSQIRNSEGQVIGLIGVARDITERKRAEKQSAALSSLSHRLSAATTPANAAEIIMETASTLIGWDAGYVDLYSVGGGKIIPVLTMDTIAGRRVPVEPPRLITEPTALMQLVAAQGSKLVNSADDLSMAVAAVPFGDTQRRSASRMYVPIQSGGESLGVLSIQSYTPQAYSQQDLRLLQTLADRCGDALLRIEMTEALREAEAKYRAIFENATEGIYQYTPEGSYLSANPALAKMFGFESPSELVTTISDMARQTFVRPEKWTEFRQMLETRGTVKGFEAERYRKDGSRFWMSINGHMVGDAQGRALYYEGTNQDITERKRAETVLRESEEKFRTLFESAPIGMALHDANGKYLQTNQAYQRMLGYTDEELRSSSVRRITYPDDVIEGQRLFGEFRDGKLERYQREKRYIHKDGHLVWAQASASALRNNKSELIYIISMVEDITERKELEQEVLETSANERRRVGHELHDGLGQYLAGIAFKAKALEQTLVAESLPHGAEAKELAALVSNAISQTRSLARGLDPIEVETIGLQAALQNLAVETQKFFNISCQFRCADSSLTVEPQSSLTLYRVVQEAIHNGITHGDARSIEIELRADGPNLSLRIRDDGAGFQPEHARQHGIGLRVMHYRARSLGGNLRISSRPQQGTEIFCVVPRLGGLTTDPSAIQKSATQHEGADRLSDVVRGV